ncbi:MAG: tetratricopeptide repeat protein [Oscillospiraceae bacterium]
MNMDFEAALRYIDLGSYDTAIKMLKSAIEKEENDPDTATKYRCVLGELYANLGRKDESRAEFEQVISYCDSTSTLAQQRTIAQTFIDAFDGKVAAPEAQPQKRPGYVPLVPKPQQDKDFIAKQTRKNHR